LGERKKVTKEQRKEWEKYLHGCQEVRQGRDRALICGGKDKKKGALKHEGSKENKENE
jgi:hypothetical protein